MLTILYGNKKDSSREQLYSDFAKDVKSGFSALLLVPEQFTVHAESKVFSLTGPMGGNCEVVSFRRLCYRILFAAGRIHKSNLDKAGQSVVMQRAVKELEGQLNFYNNVRVTPAFIAQLLSFKDELSRCSVKSEEVMNASEKIMGSSKDKLYELSLILSVYEGLLNEIGESSETDIEMADNALDETDAFKGFHIYIDGFFSFSKQEYELLSRLLCRCDITISLMCDSLLDISGGYGLFSEIQATSTVLKTMAEKHSVKVETQFFNEDSYHKSEDLKFLSENIFLTAKKYGKKTENITLFKASDMYDEALYCARRIKELCRNGYVYNDFAVLVRNESQYKGIIDSVFRMYNIPVFTDKKTELMAKPLILCVITALQIALGKYSTDDIFTYIKTGLTSLSEKAVSDLQRYCTVWDITPSLWEKGEFKNNPQGFAEEFKEEDKQLLSEINLSKEELTAPLFTLRDSLCGNAADMCAALYSFTEETKISSRLFEQAQKLKENGEYTLAQEAEQSYEIFVKALEQLALASSEKEIPKEEFFELLLCCLSSYDIGRIPTSLDEVIIGSPDRLKCNEKKCVFVLGLNDGVFPANISDTGLVTDNDRKNLAEVDVFLEKSCDEQILRERFYAYFAYTLPSERLYLLCSAQSAQKQEQAMSYFMSAVKDMFSLNVLQEDEFPLQDEKMLLESLAQNGFRNKELCEYFENSPKYSTLYNKLIGLKDFAKSETAISKKLNERLSTKGLSASPSRLETYFNCRFAHFCRYILGIKELRKANIDSPQVGTFIHHALEIVLKEAINKGIDIWNTPKAELEEQLDEIVKDYLEGYLGGSENKSARFVALFNRLRMILSNLIERLCDEFKDCTFKTVDFEMKIGDNGQVPSLDIAFDGGSIRVSGVVDRIDMLDNGTDKFIRVVDYKTGPKKFNMHDVYNGINLQMLLYLFSLCKNGGERYGGNLRPAGILYYPADEAILLLPRNMSKENKQSQKQKKYVQNGLLIRDVEILEGMEHLLKGKFIPASVKADGSLSSRSSVTTEKGFAAIEKHIAGLLSQIGREMVSGNVTPNPFKCNRHNSCAYCSYNAICGYEPIRGGRDYENYDQSELKNIVEEVEDDE